MGRNSESTLAAIGQLATTGVAVEKLAPRNHAQKHRARTPYKRFSPAAYTFLVTDFDLVSEESTFSTPTGQTTHRARFAPENQDRSRKTR
jgi:hypothetical protein